MPEIVIVGTPEAPGPIVLKTRAWLYEEHAYSPVPPKLARKG